MVIDLEMPVRNGGLFFYLSIPIDKNTQITLRATPTKNKSGDTLINQFNESGLANLKNISAINPPNKNTINLFIEIAF